jgi:DNA-binding response OmpR family regulator
MRSPFRILLVDDDAALRRSLCDQLALNQEFLCVECDNGARAFDLARSERFDAILLDVGLPDVNGRDLCRQMRRAGIKAPIVMLTAADSEADTVSGLDSGADDYVTKPFRLSVLLARLRARLRQNERSEDAVFTIGPYTFQASLKLLIDGARGKRVRLTEKEAAILKYLYRAGDQAIGRERLLGEVWGYNAGVTTHTLETHVYRLRQKIERDPARAAILVTVPGGYRLVP